MKKLTLELWDKIVEAFYRKSLNHLNMIGHATKDEAANYLGFYGINNSLYWSEQDGEIRGVSTAHPGIKNLDWNWGEENGIWTAHVVWADNAQAHAEVLKQFLLAKHPVKELYTWRKKQAVPLTARKLERILSYGRRRRYCNSSPAGAKLRRLDEGDPAITSGSGPAGIRVGTQIPTALRRSSGESAGVSGATIAKHGEAGLSSDCGHRGSLQHSEPPSGTGSTSDSSSSVPAGV